MKAFFLQFHTIRPRQSLKLPFTGSHVIFLIELSLHFNKINISFGIDYVCSYLSLKQILIHFLIGVLITNLK